MLNWTLTDSSLRHCFPYCNYKSMLDDCCHVHRWIPGYGKKFLDQGNNMYVRTGDLTAQQWVNLFREITSSGDFANSNLKIAFDTSGQSLDVLDPDEDELEEDKIISNL